MSEDERKPSPTLLIYADGREELWFGGKLLETWERHLFNDLNVVDYRKERADDNEDKE